MFEKEHNSEELNKIIGAISDKYDVLSNDNEKTNNVWLEEEICEQMNPIKVEDLDAISLEEVREKWIKKYEKMVTKVKLMNLVKNSILTIQLTT